MCPSRVFAPALAVAAIVYLFIKNVSPQPQYPANLAIWISVAYPAKRR